MVTAVSPWAIVSCSSRARRLRSESVADRRDCSYKRAFSIATAAAFANGCNSRASSLVNGPCGESRSSSAPIVAPLAISGSTSRVPVALATSCSIESLPQIPAAVPALGGTAAANRTAPPA
jgi:hypothetical protein